MFCAEFFVYDSLVCQGMFFFLMRGDGGKEEREEEGWTEGKEKGEKRKKLEKEEEEGKREGEKREKEEEG